MKRNWVLAGLVVMLSGCVTHENLRTSTPLSDLSGDSIIVMGVSPDYQVEIGKGFANGNTVTTSSAPGALAVYPKDGYIVGKVPARTGSEVHLLVAIRPKGYGMFEPLYMPCNGEQTPTFEAPAGKVIYVGDITLGHYDKKNIALRYSSNFNAAKAYIAKNYPELSAALVKGPIVLRSIAHHSCAPFHVPVRIIMRMK